MKLIFLSLIFINFGAEASLFQKIYSGYQDSDRLKEIELNEKFTELDYVIGAEQYDWTLGANYEYRDSFLEALFNFNAQPTITDTVGFTLQRPTYRYGTFSFTNTQTAYNLSEWDASFLTNLPSDRLFESRNVLKYEYDFLNQTSQVDWEIVKIQNEANRAQDRLRTDQDHFDFFKAYVTAKHKIQLHKLYKEFEKRARDRVNQISRRVKDGLSRRVDLDQARLSLYNQQETIVNNKSELRLAVATIEDIVGFSLPEADYKYVNWSFKSSKKNYNFLLDQPKFIEVESLTAQNELAEANVKKVDETSGQSLKLNLSYTKNVFEEQSSEAYQQVFGPGDRDEKIVSVNYTYPLGRTKRNAVKEKLTLQRNKTLLNLKNRKGDLQVQHRVLLENIERFESAINLADKKIRVARRVVKENKRLYLRGQITFEEELRAEETLINARLSRVNSLLAHENALSELAMITGEIKPFLRDYKD